MKLFLYIYLIFTLSSANHLDTNTSDDSNTTVEIISPEVQEIKSENINQTQEKSKDITHTKEDVIVVEDESGLSDDAIREKAKATDKEKIEKVSVSEVVEALDNTGQVDISKIQNKWEELSPTPVKYDWVKTKSGEWFKGEIKAMYNDEMEFDSDEIGLYTFDFGDVVEIRSYNIISLNIENLATFPGVLRLKGDDVSIIQGEHRYEFKRQDVVSFAPDGTKERHFWSGKGTFSFDTRSGNTDQYDYTGQLKIQRRTANSHLRFDYLGRITEKNQEETANNHRLNQKYDRYLTRDMFWTSILPSFIQIHIKIFNYKLQVELVLVIH
ncbi:MAG TPA: DUF481 domain-containing protein [Sulfurimonas sp.]|nr:DUF481 domain-containing protein [Sulfurimonas sp.]